MYHFWCGEYDLVYIDQLEPNLKKSPNLTESLDDSE